MIKNEKQYRVSVKKLADLTERIKFIRDNTEFDELRKELMSAPLLNLKIDLEKQLKSYSNLKSKKGVIPKKRRFADLPKLIIEYKIASGMTQKNLSEKIGLKEQQWQRYEAEDFGSISFRKLIDILDRLGLDITINANRKKSIAVTD